MKVVVRVRPFTSKESSQLPDNTSQIINNTDRIKFIRNPIVCHGSSSLTFCAQLPKAVGKSNFRRTFKYSEVLDQHTLQYEMFEATTKPVIPQLLDGYNATIFAYGATGCGKTFTMFGYGEGEEPGIVIRTIVEMLHMQMDDPAAFEIHMSYLEIYNEQLRDLIPLPNRKVEMGIRSRNGSALIMNYGSHLLKTENQFYELLDRGNARRQVAATAGNSVSSRSHAILKFNLKNKRANKTSCLTFVDLAGSERASKHDGARFQEGTQINKSLLALGNCLNALAQKSKYVPYRESTLTRVLQPSLSGNSIMIMVACVSPNSNHSTETLNTLKYAETASNIRGKPKQNELARSGVEVLKRDLEATQQANKHLICENKSLKKDLQDVQNNLLEHNSYIQVLNVLYERDISCWYKAEGQVDKYFSASDLPPDIKLSVVEHLKSLVGRRQAKLRTSPPKKRVRWSMAIDEEREYEVDSTESH